VSFPLGGNPIGASNSGVRPREARGPERLQQVQRDGHIATISTVRTTEQARQRRECARCCRGGPARPEWSAGVSRGHPPVRSGSVRPGRPRRRGARSRWWSGAPACRPSGSPMPKRAEERQRGTAPAGAPRRGRSGSWLGANAVSENTDPRGRSVWAPAGPRARLTGVHTIGGGQPASPQRVHGGSSDEASYSDDTGGASRGPRSVSWRRARDRSAAEGAGPCRGKERRSTALLVSLCRW